MIPEQRQQRAGFTLVEILIVVVLLGTLAVIAISQYTDTTGDARASDLVTRLKTIRNQAEWYKIQHNHDWPTDTGKSGGDWKWEKLTESTDASGDTSGDRFGPYLLSRPKNPSTGTSAVKGSAGSDAGWVIKDGKIYATMPEGAYDRLFDIDGDGRGDHKKILPY